MSSMTRSVATLSIVVGVIELVVTTVSVTTGIVAVTTFNGHPSASAGIWTSVFVIPGILSIVAGKTKSVVTLAVALFFNIVATVVSSAAGLVCMSFWLTLAHSGCDNAKYGYDCDSYHKVFAVIVVMTIVMALLTITSLTGCIAGCIGTCCAPANPVIITTVPPQQSTVIINSQSSCPSQPQPSYHPMVSQNTAGSMVQAYTGIPVQKFGVENISSVETTDDQPLIGNIVL